MGMDRREEPGVQEAGVRVQVREGTTMEMEKGMGQRESGAGGQGLGLQALGEGTEAVRVVPSIWPGVGEDIKLSQGSGADAGPGLGARRNL